MPQCSMFADKSKTFFVLLLQVSEHASRISLTYLKREKKSLLSDVYAGKQAVNNVAIAVYSDL